ncbi:MAG: 4-phosphoerythronate dehydrogenase [Ignavibacteria bacterium]|nr:4-phosphoerythronate dehydrogenase [Ignavibacteria bacterium]MBT8382270.1 4-phosphoerythronate dehydrogenase [Ignavibacteria bacterium]MBT8390943.1 4-phosphoerythronate dehydrogenase [Ignavibacteria bacterium]NNJ51568.1 4-phosphoerythronate dehydrogenase [Ignavibacteriaceae bacterium]NNL19959.1 4-phosphoerythronate dehydrogenase [Ignavibacteriaceae bacterium]
MKIVIDDNIIFAEDAFSMLGSISLLNGRLITNKILKNTDALIVRSITSVNEELLKKTKIKFIGTATIGTDHIDTNYLQKNKIVFADAKSCNADSVAEYVFTALLKIAADEKISLSKKTIGIIGVGIIGSRIEKLARALGMKVLKNDPPKEREGIGSGYVSLNDIFDVDIITLHVPLNKKGKDKTFHLLGDKNLKHIKEGTIIINTSRGEVIKNSALLKESRTKSFKLVLDVWENEPNLNTELIKEAQIGTSHIAGYSFEGKTNGTKLIYDALCNHLNKKPTWEPSLPVLEHSEISLPEGKTIEERLFKLFCSIYNIEKDNDGLRNVLHLKTNNLREEYFDLLRKLYPLRREFTNYTISLQAEDLALKPILEAFRFKIKK